MKTANCMCCGKTWTGLRLYRKKPKGTASLILHNAFCSRKCAWKFKNSEADRKSRCSVCRKATGVATVSRCGECLLPPAGTWDRKITEWIRLPSEHIPKSWDDKLWAMMSTNRHREAIAVVRELKPKKKRKSRRRTAWLDKWNEACSEMILQFRQEQKRAGNKDQWTNTLYNWQTNHGKRMRLKEHRLRLKECEQS